MIEYTVLVKPQDGLSKSAFFDEWLEPHFEAITRLPGLQAATFKEIVYAPGFDTRFHGIGLLQFENVDAVMRALTSTEGREVRVHSGSLIDQTSVVRLLARNRASWRRP